MKCPTCKVRMKCLDTRWSEASKETHRRWKCDKCNSRGKTKETWLVQPVIEKPKTKQPKPKKLSEVDKAVNRIADALYGGKTKQPKEVKHKPTKAMFDDMEEDTRYSDYSDLGIDIPRGDDW
jgi:transcriptional regulator NrdR family protein